MSNSIQTMLQSTDVTQLSQSMLLLHLPYQNGIVNAIDMHTEINKHWNSDVTTANGMNRTNSIQYISTFVWLLCCRNYWLFHQFDVDPSKSILLPINVGTSYRHEINTQSFLWHYSANKISEFRYMIWVRSIWANQPIYYIQLRPSE